MRCTWSTTANFLLRKLSYSNSVCYESRATFRNVLRSSSAISPNFISKPHGSHSASFITSSRRLGRSNRVSEYLQTREAEPATTASALTHAQCSRASAKAVRLSIAGGELHNAYVIVNSLRLSSLRNDHSLVETPGLRTQIERFNLIPFAQPVAPRLATHALLHGLIRQGLSVKASQLASLMMQTGIGLHSASMNATIISLLPKPSEVKITNERNQIDYGAKVLNLRSEMVSDRCTRYAIRLLLQSRRYQKQRSQKMFQSLINACLLQGEILVGSLLFAMVVHEWRLGQSLAAQLGHLSEEADTPVGLRRKDYRYPIPAPQQQWLHDISSSIDASLSEQDPDLQTSLQALANLAMLLESRQLPFPQLSPLIRTLYRCPRVETKVWIRRRNRPVLVEAYGYTHSVLKQLMSSLPSDPPSENVDDVENHSFLPPLDLDAYNALLHYALRHRYSPQLADSIIKHMMIQRWKPLKPSIVTYNILLRAGTLLRRPDIANLALAGIQLNTEGKDNHIASALKSSIPKAPLPDVSVQQFELSTMSRFRKALARLNSEKMDVPLEKLDTPLVPDSFTLSTYLTHLTSTGQPHVVARILFQLLPELSVVDHPSWGTMSKEERRLFSKISRRKCIERATSYGPYFFTTILNALGKAGKTGLAERVWLLAKEAERVSWIEEFTPKSGPWCLPVHAYTSMIQCYAAEARRSRALRLGRRATRLPRNFEDDNDWVPKSKHHVRGWARFIISRNKILRQKLCRGDAGRQMGMVLFQSMNSAAKQVYEALLSVRCVGEDKWKNVQVPSPDARFFNAVLALFIHRPGLNTYSMRNRPVYWRRLFQRTRSAYARRGTLPKHWYSPLRDVALEIVEAGYPLPAVLRYLLVGRWTPAQIKGSPPLDRRPHSFPMHGRRAFHPHTVPTVKTRGLPIPRKMRRRRDRARTSE